MVIVSFECEISLSDDPLQFPPSVQESAVDRFIEAVRPAAADAWDESTLRAHVQPRHTATALRSGISRLRLPPGNDTDLPRQPPTLAAPCRMLHHGQPIGEPLILRCIKRERGKKLSLQGKVNSSTENFVRRKR